MKKIIMTIMLLISTMAFAGENDIFRTGTGGGIKNEPGNHYAVGIDRVEEKGNQNGAMALATAHALSINNLDAGESALGAGIGVCENAQAISIALKHQVTEDLGVSASVAGSQAGTEEMRTMYGAGLSLRF